MGDEVKGLAIGALSSFALVTGAQAHDPQRPDLDRWYSTLHRQGGYGMCCNKTDCHRTDAEVRKDGHWWARLGHPESPSTSWPPNNEQWVLDGWREIKDEVIVRDEKGKIVENPEGQAVICHERSWDQGAHQFTTISRPESVIIFCFVPEAQW